MVAKVRLAGERSNMRCVSNIYLQWGACCAPHTDIHLGDDSTKGSHEDGTGTQVRWRHGVVARLVPDEG